MFRKVMPYAIVFIFMLAFFVSSSADYQNETKNAYTNFDTRDGLKIIIELDKATYSLVNDPALKVILKNVSQLPLTLYKNMGWGAASSLFFAIGDSNGKLVRPDVLSDAQDYPPFSTKDFITLKPDEEFTLWRRFDWEGQGITKSGEYSITVWYHSPVSEENAPKAINVWTKEKGTIRSKPFAFKVTQ